jgi:cytochrome oxidase Cu insertion factor (SCO1/SenC/PrrC family)
VRLLAALAAGGVLLGAALVLFLQKTESEERRADAGRLMTELMSGKAAVGGPFALHDARGNARSLSDFRGKLVLLYFGYTQCPDVCPTDLARIGAMLRSLGAQAEAVQPLFVTLDPQRDTPEVLREYAAAFHPQFVALRGSEEETRRIATSYKVFYEKVPQPQGYLIDHTPLTFLLDREGKYIAFFPPGTPADRMTVMVREALQQPG